MRKPNHVLKAVYDARPLRRDREQYLDDSLFRESPYHSLRLQNTRHSNPFRSRALANYENTLFANEMRNMRGKEHLPLTDLAGNSLRGQFVFPAHAYSFNPNPRTIGGSTAPDIPMNLKTGLPLNLFGFKGKMPQRFGKNIQEEGVIYGDLNEEDVVQLNKLPLRHDDIREAGRALLPTHHGRLSGRARADKIEEAMRVLMEAEIPPALYNQEMLDLENIHEADNPNLTTPGYMGAYLQPFRQWEQGEGYRVRDLDRQEEMGLISPEQRMLMDDNLGQIDPSGTFYRSEPMEIAIRLLKAAYGSREEPPTMTRLMQGNYAEKPDACTLCGNSPVVAGAQFRNPLGSINYTHHLCEPCANQYDIMHSADMYKGEPMDLAMRLLKEFYIGDDEEGMQGFYTPADISNEALLSIPRNQTMNRMSGVDKNTVQEIQNKGDYTTGGSQPRLQSNGDFIGADVRGINDSDESIQGLANILGHEYTHSLINPEINEWAEQQHGPLQSQVKPEYPTDMQGASFLQRLKTKPTNQAEMDAEKQRVALANQARVYAHEYGAHQSDQSNQTGVNEMLQQRPDTYEYWNHLQSQQPQMIQQGEPMEIAMQLLKERVSPEAKRHKLEYDKKYESSPERVKYREELNRERRRRHIMGQGGPDMSHTSQHTIVPEDPHTNRARHFKDKGTLL